jgi:glutaredoxin
MAILKLYGAGRATCTRRVGTVLHELQVPFELISVNMMEGEHKRPEYLKKQPFGQTPYIVCGLSCTPHISLSRSLRLGRRRLHLVRDTRDMPLPRSEVPSVQIDPDGAQGERSLGAGGSGRSRKLRP